MCVSLVLSFSPRLLWSGSFLPYLAISLHLFLLRLPSSLESSVLSLFFPVLPLFFPRSSLILSLSPFIPFYPFTPSPHFLLPYLSSCFSLFISFSPSITLSPWLTAISMLQSLYSRLSFLRLIIPSVLVVFSLFLSHLFPLISTNTTTHKTDIQRNTQQFADKHSIVRVRETRVTQIVSHIMIGLSVLLVPYPLAYIPTAVLDGLFLYMAVTSLSGNQMFERITLLFMEQVSRQFIVLSLNEQAYFSLNNVMSVNTNCCSLSFSPVTLLSLLQIVYVSRLHTLPTTIFEDVPRERFICLPYVRWFNWESCVSLDFLLGHTLRWSSPS